MATDKLGGAGMLEYLKHAFVARWNLLLCFGAAAAAVLSPWPDVLLPLIAAGEMIYLGGVISMPRFREAVDARSEEHTSELQSHHDLVCRLLLEKKNKIICT